MIGFGDFSSPKHIYNEIASTNHEQSKLHCTPHGWMGNGLKSKGGQKTHMLFMYLSALSKFAIISNIIELILHSLCVSKQSDLLIQYNF